MKKVFCFGELLLRMSPVLGQQWLKTNVLPVFVGGAELNVAQALAGWQVPVQYCTALPQNYLSQEICDLISEKHVDMSRVHFSGERIGTYYLPQGADLKNAGVIYDRAYSSFASLKPGMINWDETLKDANWFHFSAISPALNTDAVAVLEEALQAATRLGLTISVDLNYRAKLWQYGKKPVEVMPALAKYCHVIMGNIWAAANLLGMPLNETLVAADNSTEYLQHAVETSNAIMQHFPTCHTVANTFRFDKEGGGILYYAALQTGGRQYVSPTFTIDKIVDKVGSGDCFMGGLIYSMYNSHQPQDIINYAAAAAFGKLQEVGDATRQDVAAVQSTIQRYEQKR
ncbi:2-dehydro-3-deoxygluconokinase [Filimonas lacunae]|uniref:2-dehydro-3-deoxygluconokinase n=1 Tax=Filimonas lacunae TaxID=477680 RepID=A0A1N7R9D5_9BACT|nr:sugar kinase [Filimonas lacunae]SIT31712.1 2-dehydro-3-deoxygluconokinase [Filimonas lacunae]